jgi:hypothetical protein
LYYTHGGGMVAGSSRMLLDRILDLGEPHGAVVVAVEYRLAPEHPDPAPVEDCYSGFVWTSEHAAELNIPSASFSSAAVQAAASQRASLCWLETAVGPHPSARSWAAQCSTTATTRTRVCR